LLGRVFAHIARAQELLADQLAAETGDHVLAHVAAAQLLGARNALSVENHRLLLAGETADAVYPGAVERAERAFDLVENGLGGYAVR
jgi:hypothetical protein